jgi:phosphonate transport system substrate-binding protein
LNNILLNPIVCCLDSIKQKTLITVLMVLTLTALVGCDSEPSSYQPQGQLVERNYYVFGVHPYLTPEKTFERYAPLLAYLEQQIPTVSFVLETSQTYTEYEQKLYTGKFHFSLPNPYQTYQAIDSGYRVVVKTTPDSLFRGLLVARKSAQITNTNQLKHKTISFASPTALAATMMPLFYLQTHGLDVHQDINIIYTQTPYSTIMSAYSGDSLMAGTWPVSWQAWQSAYPELASEMEVVWETESLVNNSIVASPMVSEAISQQIGESLVGLANTEEGKAILARSGIEGFGWATNDHYLPVRAYIERYNRLMGTK